MREVIVADDVCALRAFPSAGATEDEDDVIFFFGRSVMSSTIFVPLILPLLVGVVSVEYE